MTMTNNKVFSTNATLIAPDTEPHKLNGGNQELSQDDFGGVSLLLLKRNVNHLKQHWGKTLSFCFFCNKEQKKTKNSAVN